MNISELGYITVVTLWLLGLTYAVYRFYTTKRRIFTMANNWAAHMGKKSGEVRHDAAQGKLVASGQAKLMDNIMQTVPGAAIILKSSGLSDQEGWAMITDPATMKGIKVIVDALGGVAKFVDKAGDRPKRRRSKRSAAQAPLVEYKPG